METISKKLTCYRIVHTERKDGKLINNSYSFNFSAMGKLPEPTPKYYYQMPHDIEIISETKDFSIGDTVEVTVANG